MPRFDADAQKTLREIVAAQIADGRMPGAVVAVGDDTHPVMIVAMGATDVSGASPMTADTVFDLASLTKAVATTTAILQLASIGALALDEPVAHYWPAFGARGKSTVTVRQLLTHTSGLPPELPRLAADPRALRRDLAAVAPAAAPGTREIYSDVNFAVLGVLVERVGKKPLDIWCRQRIFAPLGMRDTGFRIDARLRARAAPTTADRLGMRRGRVHDPLAAALGGVAGNAGLFSTAADLARFAQMLLEGGRRGTVRVLDAASVAALATPRTIGQGESATRAEAAPDAPREPSRGLGWMTTAPLVANRDRLAPVGAVTHTGYTGTALWIDFATRRFAIVLTNRVHPDDRGDARPLREQVSALVASTAHALTQEAVARRLPWTSAAIVRAQRLPPARRTGDVAVLTGIDVLRAQRFAPLAGLRIGLVTNRSGFDAAGERTIDLLAHAPGVALAALFAPEHGIATAVDTPFANALDATTGLPVHSLYGRTQRFSDAALAGLDALVFDIQDAGVRFFTYETTLGYALEAVAAHGIPLFVLDRPDPSGADRMGGAVSDAGRASFTGYFPLPLLPGMTVGELATFFNAQRHIGADLRVIRMTGYTRTQRFEDTGLGWVPLSPHLRSLAALDLYPDAGLVEGANVSVGRGTPHPFEWLGAPWIDAERLASALRVAWPAARFEPIDFVPTESAWRGRLCHGVRIADAAHDRPPGALGIALIATLHALYPEHFDLAATRDALGSAAVYDALTHGADAATAAAIAATEAARFADLRRTALLY